MSIDHTAIYLAAAPRLRTYINMAERQEIKVRNLTSLSILIGNQTIRISLAKLSTVSNAQHIANVYAELERKVNKVTGRAFHSVAGYPALDDETLLAIFAALYGSPYELDGIWTCPWDVKTATGAFELIEPGNNAADPATTKGSNTEGKKKTRSIPQVRHRVVHVGYNEQRSLLQLRIPEGPQQ